MDHHFCFKEGYNTDICILVFKEIDFYILYKRFPRLLISVRRNRKKKVSDRVHYWKLYQTVHPGFELRRDLINTLRLDKHF